MLRPPPLPNRHIISPPLHTLAYFSAYDSSNFSVRIAAAAAAKVMLKSKPAVVSTIQWRSCFGEKGGEG
jgi:hypothetical protein